MRPKSTHSLAQAAVLCGLLGPAAAWGQTVAITGGKIYPVSGPPVEHATILIVDGTIRAVGADVAVPEGAREIDARGKWVTPGFVHPASSLGVVEVDAVSETNDSSAKGEGGVAAAFRVWDDLNPASMHWTPAREDGVTTTVVVPDGTFVAGQAALVETLEGSAAEMVRKAPVGMVVDLTDRTSAGVGARGQLLERLRELLEDARVFAAKPTAFEGNQLRRLSAGRTDLEALVPVVRGTLPLIAHVERRADIEGLLALARELKVKVIVLGGAEAWQAADDLASAKVPVLTGGLTNLPSDFDQLGATLENAARLRKAGVLVALTTGGENNFRARGIRQHAGNAVANGLPWDEALRAVTLTPAEIFGVADRMGSLQPGRDGTVVVWDGDPFELATRAEHVLVRGKESSTRSREELLTERYRR
jgi:imidazolonepropionase-like amidohydrolase